MATHKQEKAMKVVISGGSPTEGMKVAGYAPSVIRKPKVLTGSKAWKELMDKFIPDELLAEKHRELLEVPKKVRTYVRGELTNEYEELDSQAVSKGLDMGYKLKGRYAPDKVEHSGEITETLKLDRKTDKIIEKVLKERKKDI